MPSLRPRYRFFSVGASGNDDQGTDLVGLSGLLTGTLEGASLYKVTVEDLLVVVQHASLDRPGPSAPGQPSPLRLDQQPTVDQRPVVHPGQKQGNQPRDEHHGRRRVGDDAQRKEEGDADERERTAAVQGVEHQREG